MPKSAGGGKKGSVGRGSCAATLAACMTSRVASDDHDEDGAIGENGRGREWKGEGVSETGDTRFT